MALDPKPAARNYVFLVGLAALVLVLLVFLGFFQSCFGDTQPGDAPASEAPVGTE